MWGPQDVGSWGYSTWECESRGVQDLEAVALEDAGAGGCKDLGSRRSGTWKIHDLEDVEPRFVLFLARGTLAKPGYHQPCRDDEHSPLGAAAGGEFQFRTAVQLMK